MKSSEENRRTIWNPPPNSKIAEALDFGVDFSLLFENLKLSPQERIARPEEAMCFFEDIDRKSEKPNSQTNNFGNIIYSLSEKNVEFVIVGEIACYVHGWKHISLKLEITYSKSEENLKKIVEALSPFQPYLFNFSTNPAFDFNENLLGLNEDIQFKTNAGMIYLLNELDGIGDYNETEKLSEEINFYGNPTKILTLAGLIKTKKATGKKRDLLILPELEVLK